MRVNSRRNRRRLRTSLALTGVAGLIVTAMLLLDRRGEYVSFPTSPPSTNANEPEERPKRVEIRGNGYSFTAPPGWYRQNALFRAYVRRLDSATSDSLSPSPTTESILTALYGTPSLFTVAQLERYIGLQSERNYGRTTIMRQRQIDGRDAVHLRATDQDPTFDKAIDIFAVLGTDRHIVITFSTLDQRSAKSRERLIRRTLKTWEWGKERALPRGVVRANP